MYVKAITRDGVYASYDTTRATTGTTAPTAAYITTWASRDIDAMPYQTYTYDCCFLNCLASCRGLVGWSGLENNADVDTYYEAVKYSKENGTGGGGNWVGQNLDATSIRFYLLGAAMASDGYTNNCKIAVDSRKAIKRGNCVEVDYIIFGSSSAQLDEWHSYIEESSINAK